MTRKLYLAAAAVALVAIGGGIAALLKEDDGPPRFHDYMVMEAQDYTGLVDPDQKSVRQSAAKLKTFEEAYGFVRDEVRYAPFLAAGKPAETLEKRAASCLGKAALLCSLYRAMGAGPDSVRVVTGIVNTPNGLAEHAWVDMEYKGVCYQQDPSGFLGSFEFGEFGGSSFTSRYVFKENLCFNDMEFGVISQLNRMKTAGR